MLMQAIADHNYISRDICIGWPGSVHDTRIFANSFLYKKLVNKQILINGSITICNKEIPIFLVRNSAYPMNRWLLKPFAHNTALTSKQKLFNYRLSRARIVIEV